MLSKDRVTFSDSISSNKFAFLSAIACFVYFFLFLIHSWTHLVHTNFHQVDALDAQIFNTVAYAGVQIGGKQMVAGSSILGVLQVNSENLDGILKKIESYSGMVDWFINIYDKEFNFTRQIPHVQVFNQHPCLTKIHFYHSHVNISELDPAYEYIFFLDEDMEFGKPFFNFDLFLDLAVRTGSSIVQTSVEKLSSQTDGSIHHITNIHNIPVTGQNMAYVTNTVETGRVMYTRKAWEIAYELVETTQILDSDWGLDHVICGAVTAKFGSDKGCVIIQATPLMHMDMKTHFRKEDDKRKKQNSNANSIYKSMFPSYWDGEKFKISRMLNMVDLYPETFAEPYDAGLCSPEQFEVDIRVPLYSKVTIVIQGYDSARESNYPKFLKEYQSWPEVADIILLFSNPSAPNFMKQFNDRFDKVTVVTMETSSIHNRFLFPHHSIRTKAILSLDDDMLLSHQSFICMLTTWQMYPSSLVGSEQRMLEQNEDGSWKYRWGYESEESWGIILTSNMIYHKHYLDLYETIGQHIFDGLPTRSGEDILMNILITHCSKHEVIRVQAEYESLVQEGGIHRTKDSKSWLQQRSNIATHILTYFGNYLGYISTSKAYGCVFPIGHTPS